MENEYETASKLSNATSLNDLEWPLTQVSRSRYYSISNNGKKRYKIALYFFSIVVKLMTDTKHRAASLRQQRYLFSAEGGPISIKFRRLVQNDMSVKIETRCRIPIWRTFGRIQWHVIPEPHATLQDVRIPSTILKIVFFRHILFYFILLFF